MEKKNLKKLALSLSLVGVIGVGATLAALSDTTGSLTNKFTFTSNGISIKLDEAKVDDKNQATAERIDATENNQEQEYKNIVPNMLIDKDPTVTVLADSINCNVFVSVENSNDVDTLKILDLSSDWQEITPSVYGYTAQANTKYYVYMGSDATGTVEDNDVFKVVANSATDTKLTPVFNHVKVGDLERTTEFKNIVIKAAAYQADSQTDEDVAKLALEALGATANQNQE